MSAILLPYKDAIKAMGLSRASFDTYVRPFVRSIPIGRRIMFSKQELEQFAMERLGGDNGPATDALRDQVSMRESCQEKERPAFVAGASKESGQSKRRSELEANQSRFASLRARVRSKRQNATSQNESKSFAQLTSTEKPLL